MLKIRSCGMLFRNMWNQPTYPMMWLTFSEDLSLQQDCIEDIKSTIRATMLNINEASVDLFGNHAELKMLLKTFSFLVAQKINATNNKFLNFACECYPEPMSSQQFKCTNSTWVSSCFIFFDFTWPSYESPSPRGATTWFRAVVPHDVASWSHAMDTPQFVELLWRSDQPNADTCTWEHSFHKRQISMPPAYANSKSQQASGRRPHVLIPAVTGIDLFKRLNHQISVWSFHPAWATCSTRHSVCSILC